MELVSESFSGLSRLTTLSLQNNQIKHIASTVFKDLISLKDLKFQTNQLIGIEAEYFQNLFNLTSINLESNQIVYISRNSFMGLMRLTSICLNDNPISNQFPDSLNDICSSSPYCLVYVSTKCANKKIISRPFGLKIKNIILKGTT